MGKRPVVVISSSDDEDGGCSVSAGCNSSRTKSERSVGRKKCRRLKKASVLNRQLCKQGHKEEEVCILCLHYLGLPFFFLVFGWVQMMRFVFLNVLPL